MTPLLFWALAFSVFLLVLVGVTGLLEMTERRVPRFHRWLNDWVGPR